MSTLFLVSNFIYEMSIYLLVLSSYFDKEANLPILLIMMVISLLLSAIPSTLYKLNYRIDKKITNSDGFLKLLQFFTIFVIMPFLGRERVMISIIILIVVSITGIPNRILIFNQLKEENIKLFEMNNRIVVDEEVNKDLAGLTKLAWRTLFPFLLLGLYNNRVESLYYIIPIIVLLESVVILHLYRELSKLRKSLTKPFLILVLKSIGFLILLFTSIVLDKSGMLKYFIVGAFSVLYVDFVKYEFENDWDFQSIKMS